jgi:hypothetical protein
LVLLEKCGHPMEMRGRHADIVCPEKQLNRARAVGTAAAPLNSGFEFAGKPGNRL